MPLLQINTNAEVDDKQAVMRHASTEVASMLGKPESYVMIILNTDMDMQFGGSEAACAHLKLKSLGLDESQTTDYSQRLCKLVEASLGVPPQRTYIEFSGPARHLWGWDNRTF